MKKSHLFRALFSVIFTAALMIFSVCREPVEEEVDEGGPGIIVPGKSIEGINLGDTREIVLAKLGMPSTGGLLEGFYRNWCFFTYSSGPHSGLHIAFIEIYSDTGSYYGPADLIWVDSTYTGKTKGGIGIGDTITVVHKILGKADKIWKGKYTPDFQEIYCYGTRFFYICYRNNIAQGFYMGYYVPMPEDTIYSCK